MFYPSANVSPGFPPQSVIKQQAPCVCGATVRINFTLIYWTLRGLCDTQTNFYFCKSQHNLKLEFLNSRLSLSLLVYCCKNHQCAASTWLISPYLMIKAAICFSLQWISMKKRGSASVHEEKIREKSHKCVKTEVKALFQGSAAVIKEGRANH